MIELLWAFWDDDAGTTTVEWVVLSAAVIGLGMVVLLPVAFNTENATQNIADYIETAPIGAMSN